MRTGLKISAFIVAALLQQSLVRAQEKEVVMIVSGHVKDSVTDSPIEQATIAVSNSDISPVQTDKNGKFKFIILASKPILMRVTKEGYAAYEKLLEPQGKIELTIKLEKPSSKKSVAMTEFRSKSYISGRVEGLSTSEYRDYKILVYVLTDKWYIHPWAENAEGRGYASIRDDGTWRISTVWRGYQAYRVAFLLTKRTTYAPPTVNVVSENPDSDLLSKIHFEAESIIEAPEGI